MRHCDGHSAGRGAGAYLLPFLCALLLMHGPDDALGNGRADGRVEIRSAYTQLSDEVFYLSARIDFVLSDAVRTALDNGVKLDIELRINVSQTRRYLWDSTIASLRQRYQLSFHALTQRFVLRNLNSGEQESYGDLDAVMAQLGRIERLPIIDASILDDGGRYRVNLRAMLDLRQTSGAMRLLSSIWGDWRLTSDWYSWPLQP